MFPSEPTAVPCARLSELAAALAGPEPPWSAGPIPGCGGLVRKGTAHLTSSAVLKGDENPASREANGPDYGSSPVPAQSSYDICGALVPRPPVRTQDPDSPRARDARLGASLTRFHVRVHRFRDS